MKCPKCVEEGRKSTVEVFGGSVTAMGVHQFYDEEGLYHSHDPNLRSAGWRCSNRHQGTTRWRSRCFCETTAGDTITVDDELYEPPEVITLPMTGSALMSVGDAKKAFLLDVEAPDAEVLPKGVQRVSGGGDAR